MLYNSSRRGDVYEHHGVRSYYIPDLTIIDKFGLTDATRAHNPVMHPNHKRLMAHDRRLPADTLKNEVSVSRYPPQSLEGSGECPE